MGMALGLLGMTTFLSMFGMGYCMTKKSQLNDKVKEMEEKVRRLNKEVK